MFKYSIRLDANWKIVQRVSNIQTTSKSVHIKIVNNFVASKTTEMRAYNA